MAKSCSVCGNKIPLGTASKAIDGILCVNCLNLANGSIMTRNIPISIQEISEYYKINEERKKIFTETQTLKNFGSSIVHIDNNNRLFYINKTEIYYSFNEVVGYIEESIAGPTITTTKKKGGITRALVGGAIAGPIGAVVGSNTAGSTSTSSTTIQTKKYIEIEDYSGHRKVFILPPKGLKETIEMWTQQKEKKQSNNLDNIEEIKKYKELLDMGVITQEEFDTKKKELLNL